MSRKKGLTPEEIANLLRELSENESDGGELSCSELESDNEWMHENESSESDESDDNDVRNADNNLQLYVARDGTEWKPFNAAPVPGRFSMKNILRESSGPTNFAKRNVNENVISSWKLFIDNSMLDHIRKCTESEARRVLQDDSWSLSIAELQAFISILYARGVSGAKNVELQSLWSDSWGFSFCKETMGRNRFREISRFLRFDFKSTRSQRLEVNKFAMISEVWDAFIQNCTQCYKPGPNITIDEQLFPSKTRCPFTQFIATKPDKYGQKFWLAVDLDTKYLLNAFPYMGKNENRPSDQRLSEFVVLKLMEPYKNKGYNVTVDNFFTSLELAKELMKCKTSLVGTMNRARREIPDNVKCKKNDLYSTNVYKHESTGTTLTAYQGKRQKNVIILSSLHSNVAISNNEKKTPETVRFYNETKCGVDILDQMARKYSVKAGSRRWPVHTFYNILDFAGINSWIIYKSVLGKRISRKNYIQLLADELRSTYVKGKKCEKDTLKSFPENTNKRKKCQIKNCKGNITNKKCTSCEKMVCGKCTKTIAFYCVNCI